MIRFPDPTTSSSLPSPVRSPEASGPMSGQRATNASAPVVGIHDHEPVVERQRHVGAPLQQALHRDGTDVAGRDADARGAGTAGQQHPRSLGHTPFLQHVQPRVQPAQPARASRERPRDHRTGPPAARDPARSASPGCGRPASPGEARRSWPAARWPARPVPSAGSTHTSSTRAGAAQPSADGPSSATGTSSCAGGTETEQRHRPLVEADGTQPLDTRADPPRPQSSSFGIEPGDLAPRGGQDAPIREPGRRSHGEADDIGVGRARPVHRRRRGAVGHPGHHLDPARAPRRADFRPGLRDAVPPSTGEPSSRRRIRPSRSATTTVGSPVTPKARSSASS